MTQEQQQHPTASSLLAPASTLLAKSRSLGRQLKSKVLQKIKGAATASLARENKKLEQKLDGAYQSLVVVREKLKSVERERDEIARRMSRVARGGLSRRGSLVIEEPEEKKGMRVSESVVAACILVVVWLIVFSGSSGPVNIKWILWEVSRLSTNPVSQRASVLDSFIV
ncbi:hypothetical protein BCR33DRAFT_794859 [Rhizoclosmatium globosum]|uniref:Uncharacterized protein n=1 Tax=Rhizoclosmatium globosum TaxID=329046 RepID=A0A1Y2AVR9_9FUNG|nr:hypothetical protein BCR33DRAFT_794859 [Rhizoclosmatium globosum]|eukprot:ORY26005.1 hypothetical protein BCR33DRAFT_794859 [Rhizoclosmatium globosum]